MKPNENETYHEWIERAREFEYNRALAQISKGEDPEKVLNEMASRLMNKFLYPIYESIKEEAKTEYDPIQSRKEYEEKYLKHRTPVADHVDGQMFDKEK